MKHGQEKGSFEEVIASQIEATQLFIEQDGDMKFNKIAPAYLPIGLYFYWLKKWMSVIPKNKLLILRSESLFEDPPKIVKKVFDFVRIFRISAN